MRAYYNEIDPFAAQWLRNLIDTGWIASGDVDERSISDITPSELVGYTQCHFFAGIGGWSLALRLAEWPDDRPVWTGSCPCQPFSQAGAGKGTADERHLWPHWFHLIRVIGPSVIFGEQVEAAIGHGWVDLVQDDLEGEGYALGKVIIPAACVGAPHIRHRIWFVANAERGSSKRYGYKMGTASGRVQSEAREQRVWVNAWNGGVISGLGLSHCDGFHKGSETTSPVGHRDPAQSTGWNDHAWVPCRDGKWRPTEPGTFPLAHGIPARVGRLRGYGNAIVPQVAAEVIRAYMECRP